MKTNVRHQQKTIFSIKKYLPIQTYTEVDSEGSAGDAPPPPPIFCNHLFFLNQFEELQTVLFEAELIINNAPLKYVYPNTIEIYSTPNHLLFGR